MPKEKKDKSSRSNSYAESNSYAKRIATSVVGIPALVVLLYYGTPFHFWLLITACILLGLVEFYHILARAGIHCLSMLGVGFGLLTSMVFWKGNTILPLSLVISLLVLASCGGHLFCSDDLSRAIPNTFGTIGGVFYVAWLLGHLIWIRELCYGKALIFYLLLIVWTGDTFAFYVGSYLGKHKLSPAISPKKTIEGSIGGISGSILVSIIAHFTFLKQISLGNSIFLGVLLNIFGQLGDLFESLLKRGAGVKDSGRLIPGHGGLLDRIDSLIFAGPALFYYTAIYLSRR